MIKTLQKKQLHTKLSEYMFNKTKLDAFYLIAKAILNNVDNIENVTIEEISYASNTTPSTVSKFCKEIGYTGYSELKNDKSLYTYSDIFHNYQKDFKTKSEAESIQTLSKTYVGVIEQIYNSFNCDQLKIVAKKLANSKRVTIVNGVYSNVASSYFSEQLMTFGISSFIINRDSDKEMIKMEVSESDLVFIVSLTGKWLIENFDDMNFTQEERDKVVVITFTHENLNSDVKVVPILKSPYLIESTFITINAVILFYVVLSAYTYKEMQLNNIELNQI